ncbi:MAG: 5-formyltetrahydrofolate cyclo-ligase [Nitriliruptoraceae bacterium]
MESTSKDPLRTATAAARRALTVEERQEASERIVARLLALPELRPAHIIVTYAAIREEADLQVAVAAWQERGKRILFPRVRGSELDLAEAAEPRLLRIGYRGVPEPTGPRIDPAGVDAVLVPGTAFDPRGGRLGSGGGHYDRLLPRLPTHAVRVGIGFSCQLVPHVPREDHDALMHLVVTERGVHRAPPP